ncbi:MAG: 1-acyl-sn-glycerol-3-phosphate acyltransferase [Polaribacter sp.]|nr:1-acyl-sn-glycerol-3-phosphate acyltransferase [Polaribacter sp.]MDG1811968.1 1-acyl-sn-glycerol-3-phosphate acyltransferase [Polaribacter sp.]MDG1994403.1 1-acyl-sn-glycerol-3-phosphate acyltransferase [Polaribacter sp.]
MISKFIFKTILGWKLVGDFPKDIKKYVVIAAPHTSWQDFPIGILARNTSNIKINFIGKDSLFKGPFGFIFRRLGGTPVDRSKNNNLVDAIVAAFNEKEVFRLALSPEGTRKKTTQWKTGFYYIAKGAKVPIVMATLDFNNKQVKFSEPYYTTDDTEKDFKYFKSFFKPEMAKKPDQF